MSTTRNRPRITSIFFLLLGLVFQNVSAEERPIVTVGSFPFPPLLHETSSGQFSGTMGETVKLLCAEAGLDCRFRVAPLARVYKELKSGKIDVLITLDLGQFSECCVKSLWASPWSAGLFSVHPLAQIPNEPTGMLGRSLIVVNGMRTPYSFFPELDQWDQEKRINLERARNVSTSALMFVRKRAPFLWGGEEFKWHIDKLMPADFQYSYKPLMMKNVVLWLHKDKRALLKPLDEAFSQLQKSKALDDKGLLNSSLMSERYIDAEFSLDGK